MEPRRAISFLTFSAAFPLAVACSAPDAKSALTDGNCPKADSKLCPNDDLLTQKQVDECESARSDNVCGSAYVDFLKCEGALPCDPGGHSPSPASGCASQESAYLSCTSGGTSADGGS